MILLNLLVRIKSFYVLADLLVVVTISVFHKLLSLLGLLACKCMYANFCRYHFTQKRRLVQREIS